MKDGRVRRHIGVGQQGGDGNRAQRQRREIGFEPSMVASGAKAFDGGVDHATGTLGGDDENALYTPLR